MLFFGLSLHTARANPVAVVPLSRLWRNKPGRIVMPMAPRYHNKTVEEYRQLAEKCRETARMNLMDNERGRLLEMAQVWDPIADRVERAAR